MKLKIKFTFIFLVTLVLDGVRGYCDQCNANNPVACHSETVYSLCYNGQPTRDFVTCPTDYICTNEPFVCRPKALAVPSCSRSYANAAAPSQCGLCLSKGKVFSCLNETTIAFCFGDDSPHYGSLSYCLDGTVCDLNSGSKFCTAAVKTAPSCRESDWGTTTITPPTNNPTSTVASTTAISTTTTTTTSLPITTQKPTATTTVMTTTSIPTTTTPPSTNSTPSSKTTPPSTTTTPKTTTTAPTTTTPPSTTTTPTTTTAAPTTTTSTPTTKTTTTTTSTTTTPPSTTTTPTTTTAAPTTTTSTPTATTPTTTITPTTTTEHTLTPNEICEQTGKTGFIPQLEDATCRTYFICQYKNGVWSGRSSSCPSNQRFDPNLRICSAAYTCSMDNSSTTSSAATTTPTTTTLTTTTSTTTVTTTTTEIPLKPAQICERNGKPDKIPQPNDTTCRKYIYCSKPAFRWIGQQRDCNAGYFDPVEKACTPTCPSTCKACP